MPDFLHEEQNALTPAPAGAASSRPERRRFGGVRPSAAPSEETSDVKEKKEPSKLFTQYYGAVFLLLIAVFLGAGYVLLYPLVSTFKALNRDIDSQNTVLLDEQAYLQSLEQSIAAAEAIPPDTLDRVNEALPRTIGVPKLLQTMSRIADLNVVKLNSVQFSATPPQETAAQRGRTIRLKPIDMNVTLLSPGYLNTRAFLEDLETNLRVLDVKNIAVNANEQTGELTYTILLTAYSIEPAPASAPTTAAVTPAP